jgi:hypothetical protein
MTLYVSTPERRYEISEIYIMALTFCLFFAIGKIINEVLKKLQTRKTGKTGKAIKIPNPKGGIGSMEIDFSDDSELASVILSCISDNELYVVKNPKIIELVFDLVKERLTKDSLVLTPNMMRFLALKLLSNDKKLAVRFGNLGVVRFGGIVASSGNVTRLVRRILGSAIIGIAGGLLSMFSYALIIAVFYFDSTENCGYKCHDYFEHISKDRSAIIYAEKSTGNLVIGQNDAASQVVIYIPSKVPDELIIRNTKEVVIKKSYGKSRKQAKEVKFSDFKMKDPVLSSFNNLEEPRVPQKLCLINDIHDAIGIE